MQVVKSERLSQKVKSPIIFDREEAFGGGGGLNPQSESVLQVAAELAFFTLLVLKSPKSTQGA